MGAGNFAQVNKGMWQSAVDSTEVAVKMLQPTASETDRVKFLQEAAIMGQFHHPNVVQLHGVVTVVEPVSGNYHTAYAYMYLKTKEQLECLSN